MGQAILETQTGTRSRVTVLIPALNEATNLPGVLRSIPGSLVDEIIVIDGNSTDGTAEVAAAWSSLVRVVVQSGRGKGDALRTGMLAATGDVVITLDADGSTDAAEIPAFVSAILAGNDAAFGSRYLPTAGSEDLTSIRSAGNHGLRQLVNRLFGSRFTDVTYGYNAFSASAIQRLLPFCDGFEIETLMRSLAARAGLRWVEVPCRELRRGDGESKLNARRDGMRIARTVVAVRLLPLAPGTRPRPARLPGGAPAWRAAAIARPEEVDVSRP